LVKRPGRPPEGISLEAPVDREADAERIEQRRLAAVEARNRELRDAFVWTEILGQPVAFRE
jgi:hypothetical protein